jgi:hypothetical protein
VATVGLARTLSAELREIQELEELMEEEMGGSTPTALDPAPVQELSADGCDGGKFSDAFVGSFGSTRDFIGGLHALVGPAHPGPPFPQMRAEHCDVSAGFGQSDAAFSSSPNHQDATPKREWQHVFDPCPRPPGAVKPP